ncbi:MAG TPA: preprotein translocase subunit SecG [Lachnospiraceae bacterium]|nr:preprotein translocase subunit SecG [Lachnospiraceae bacterium]HBY71381.1 preprotein translocase subunit SecG [Lachnospiraceae bacterium]HCA69011.1 preprotein translocase subunit SecG [Lachnospiraceae bacterium]HCM12481.1 preprotein translocase subunit SecG [Lachnospiraceae bacterium]HCR40365.1 preprotein translocase subunit SecG [Lachnospiraceae bacterium]
MEILKVTVQIIYVLICIVLIVIVLKQEGKSEGLTGTLTGISDSYWSKNKGRSKEGLLDNATKILGVLFVVLSVVLNLF